MKNRWMGSLKMKLLATRDKLDAVRDKLWSLLILMSRIRSCKTIDPALSTALKRLLTSPYQVIEVEWLFTVILNEIKLLKQH